MGIPENAGCRRYPHQQQQQHPWSEEEGVLATSAGNEAQGLPSLEEAPSERQGDIGVVADREDSGGLGLQLQ